MPSFLVLSRAASRCALYVPGVLLLVQYGCGDTVSPERSLLSADRVVAVSGGDQSGEVGLALSEPLIIRVLDDRDAGVANVPVSWSIGAGAGTTSSGATATDANGRAQVEWTMGTRAGPNEVSATVSGIPPATFTAVARAGAAARVVLTNDSARLSAGRDSLQLVASTQDAFGNETSPSPVHWSSLDTTVAVADTSGLVRARRPGTARVVAAIAAPAADTAWIIVDDSAALRIDRMTPAVLRPGGPATLEGRNFAPVREANFVFVDGRPVEVVQATPDRLELRLPASGFDCRPEQLVPVAMTVGSQVAGLDHPMRTGEQHRLSAGQVLLPPAEAARCTELMDDGAEYLLAVVNTTDLLSARSFTLSGSGLGAATTVTQSATTHGAAFPRLPFGSGPPDMLYGAEAAALAAGDHSAASQDPVQEAHATQVPPVVGEEREFRIPLACTGYVTVRARAAYAGDHTVIWEDVAAPMAGRMDAVYERAGRDYEALFHPTMVEVFGDPVAFHRETFAEEQWIGALMSPEVFAVRPEGGGYVAGCDFLPRSRSPASNEAPMLYGTTPRNADELDYGSRVFPTFLAHEIRHIASFSMSFLTGTAGAESWFEEATAVLAGELLGRWYNGAKWRGNEILDGDIRCELWGGPVCGTRPITMGFTLASLYGVIGDMPARSPLGPTTPGDGSFYDTGWSLVRWTTDHHATSEHEFLTRLSSASGSGLQRLAVVAGRATADLLAEWTLALALDDYPDVMFSNARVHLPSWNLRGIYGRYSQAYPWLFDDMPYPLGVTEWSRGAIEASMSLHGGSAAFFGLTTTGAGVQSIALDESMSPGGFRLAIVRLR